jgi:hypothetical protein
MLNNDFTFTKRQIGLILLGVGLLGVVGLLALDLIGGGREGGIGPAQRAGIILMALTALLGLTLIPLGDEPA